MRRLFAVSLTLAACSSPAPPQSLTLQARTAADELPAALSVHLDAPEQRRLLALPGTWDTGTLTLAHATKTLQPLTRTLAKNVDLVANGAGDYKTTIPFGTLRPGSGYVLTVQLWSGGAFGKLVAEKQQPVTLVGGVNNVSMTLALVPNLALTSASPPAALPGTSVTLNGQGFSFLKSLDKLTLGAQSVGTDTATATALTTTVPDVGPTTVPYQVQVGTSIASLPFQVLATIGSTLNWVALSSHQTDPSIAYGNGQFMVSWTDDRISGHTDIFALRLDANGLGAAPDFQVNDPTKTTETRSALAYNPETDQFYGVWQDSSNGNDIRGQLVNADGTLAGTSATITSSYSGAQTKPQVCYDATNHQFVTVYTDHRNGNNDIYGTRVSNTGAPIGADFPVIKTNKQQDNPAIAYGVMGNTYLVVWDDDTSGHKDIVGQRVNHKGQLVGGKIAVNTPDGKDHVTPAVAYNSQTGGFLVAWVDTQAGDTIRAQLLDATGALVGSPLVISSVSGAKVNPRIAYEPWWNRWVVIWNDNRSSTHWDIFGQYLEADGTAWGADFPVKVTAGNQTYAEVAVDPVKQRALVSYQDSANGGNVYGQFIR